MRVLKREMSGQDVKRWQEFLERQGLNPGTPDGSFGKNTFQATAEFQRRNGLDDDGVVGAGTLDKAKQLGFVEDADTNGTGGSSSVTAASPGSFSEQKLAEIMPNLNPGKRAAYFPFLVSAMQEFEITTPLRRAAFLAQLAHESGQFRFMEEIWGPTPAQRGYEGRRDLGNIQPGDGFRYKGRGPIQITGRANYKRYGDLLGIDLVNSPALAATPEVGFRTAGLYWKSNGCNALADGQQFVAITKRINGGTNGLEDRVRYYDRAKRALGISGTRSIDDIVRETPDTDEETGRVFTRGLDSPGEITPAAEERNAEQPAKSDVGGGRAKKGKSKKAAATKPAARKSPAGKAAASKPPAVKRTAKTAAKKSTAQKSASKPAAKKTAAKKSGAKTAAKKSVAKKSSSKKSVPLRAAKSSAKAGAAKGSGKTTGKAATGAGKATTAASRSAAKRVAKGSKAPGRAARGR
ncbi:MAG: peptidoglycan-binding protein [Pyrinomonadaceae bacterium]